MINYVQKNLHLASCFVTNPVGISFEFHVFVYWMREGLMCSYIMRGKPKLLKVAPPHEKYTMTWLSYRIYPSVSSDSAPEAMNIDTITVPGFRGRLNTGGNRTFGSVTCFSVVDRLIRATVWRTPVPVYARKIRPKHGKKLAPIWSETKTTLHNKGEGAQMSGPDVLVPRRILNLSDPLCIIYGLAPTLPEVIQS